MKDSDIDKHKIVIKQKNARITIYKYINTVLN